MTLVAAFPVGCSSLPSAEGVPENGLALRSGERGVRPATSPYQVLFSFKAGPRGRSFGGFKPDAPLIDINGMMYGTTEYGGTGGCSKDLGCGCRKRLGCGTVFSVDPAGEKKVIYRFRGGSDDGAHPGAGLLDVNGTLYGTTTQGGGGCNSADSGCGTVFSITRSGKETVLHKFAGSPSDGANPNAALVNVNGTLYGTTSQGGTNGEYCVQGGCGTVFSITASRSERVLHFFTDGKDGALPRGLVVVKGSLYGATFSGGDSTCKNGEQCGVIYRIDTDGSKTTLHLFTSPKNSFSSDGDRPSAPLTYANGALYGTTDYGGTLGGPCWVFGCGVVFSSTLKGATKVVYRFGGGDGAEPNQLISANGMLYGTTPYCGLQDCTTDGIVYSLTTAGQETTLHTFTGTPDGATPIGALLDVNGSLYGTTSTGGDTGCGGGCGTIFALSP